jgi:hypothetical protein
MGTCPARPIVEHGETSCGAAAYTHWPIYNIILRHPPPNHLYISTAQRLSRLASAHHRWEPLHIHHATMPDNVGCALDGASYLSCVAIGTMGRRYAAEQEDSAFAPTSHGSCACSTGSSDSCGSHILMKLAFGS